MNYFYNAWRSNDEKVLFNVYVNSYRYGEGLEEIPIVYICGSNSCREFDDPIEWYLDSNFTTKVDSISANQTGTVVLYAKYEYWITTTYVSYTENVDEDEPVTYLLELFLDAIYFAKVSNTSINKIKIEISFDMWEIKDGYQDIRLYNNNTEIWSDTINRGIGKNTSVYHYSNVILLDLNQYKNSNYMDLVFCAHGFSDDDWQFNNLIISISLING